MQSSPEWSCTVTDNFRLTGPLRIPLLRRALTEISLRHGSLRMRVVTVDGTTQTEVTPHRPCLLESMRIRGDSATDIETNARRTVDYISELQIDPTADLPLRARLLELSDHEHWLVMSMHRLVGDCSSIGQVFREVWSVYNQLLQDQLLEDTAPPPQYGDYALWQQRTYPEWVKRHEPYWKQRLAGAAPLQWPARTGATEAERGVLGRMHCHFGENLSAQVRELARRVKALPGTVLLAVYVAVLRRWCNQNDFVVPFLVTGRSSEYKRTLGNFSYALYLRLQLTGSETFDALVGRVSNEFYKALAHQDSGRVATQRPELLSGTVFQWITWHPDDALSPTTPTTPGATELTAERLAIRDFAGGVTAVPPGKVDVEVTFFDTAQGIYAAGAYPAERFEAETMQRFIQDVRSATEEFVRHPHTRVAPDLEEKLTAAV